MKFEHTLTPLHIVIFGLAVILLTQKCCQEHEEKACAQKGGTMRYATRIQDGFEFKGWFCVPNEIERSR